MQRSRSFWAVGVAGPYLAPAPLAVAATAFQRLSAPAAAAVVASSLGLGVARALWAHARLAQRRRQVDRWLAWGVGQPPPDELIRERMAQLVSPRRRCSLAGSVRGIRKQAVRPAVYRSSVVNTRAAAANSTGLERLAARLDALDEPVTARGVARTVELLTDGTGPLYDQARAAELGRALEQALSAL
jgi:hypothetical protein